ncbi:MAG: elongation factor Ts [Spirochaetales bacterium]|nr:elongation factor Ts [Spirochaetales bacterium]
MDIKATDVKALREKTGAGMMDCKNALVKANGDAARAEKILKELGLAAAKKRAGRATKEGRVFSRIQDGTGALLELTCETDFVAKNKEFVALGQTLAEAAVSRGRQARPEDFSSQVQEAVGKIKENITLRRLQVIEAGANDMILDYIHGEGKIGVMVRFSLSDPSLKDNPRVKEVAFDLTLHTAAFAPLFLSRDQVPKPYLDEQEEIFTKQAEKLGKPENVVKGIVQGKINKHMAEICFVDQPFIKDQNLKVSKVLEDLGKEVGGKVQISEYLYYKVGEELE